MKMNDDGVITSADTRPGDTNVPDPEDYEYHLAANEAERDEYLANGWEETNLIMRVRRLKNAVD